MSSLCGVKSLEWDLRCHGKAIINFELNHHLNLIDEAR